MNWQEYFVSITKLVAEKSTCIRRKVGAIAVKDKRILATGYNGSPSNTPHCAEIGCLRQQMNIPSGQRHEICRGVHSEQNLIIQCALYGTSIEGADIYCTNLPCVQCAKMLINCKVKNIYYFDSYPDELTLDLIKHSDVKLIKLDV